MGTWHQDAAVRDAVRSGNPIRFYDDKLWTVMHDAPNQLRSLTQFVTKADAEEYAARCRLLQPHLSHTVLPPSAEARGWLKKK